MSGLLGSSGSNASTPTELSGYRVQTSIIGTGIPIVGGTARVAGNVVWLGNWQATAANSSGKIGGKGSGGGKGGGQFTYTASFIIAVSQGPCVQTLGVYQDKTQITAPTGSQQTLLPSVFGPGGRGATPWGYLLTPGTGWYGQGIGYSEIAIECFENQSLGSGGNISNYSFEIAGNQLFGGYVTSVGSSVINFATGTNRLVNGMQVQLIMGPGGVAPTGLAGATFGLFGLVPNYWVVNATSSSVQLSLTQGGSPISFSAAGSTLPIFVGWVDSLCSDWLYFCLTGFNMAGYPASAIGDFTELETYCMALGIAISPVIDEQDTLNSYMTEYLLVCNSEMYSSEGVIKARTYGDQAVTGNGVTFTPNLVPEYDLDYDAFIVNGENQNPVTFTREAAQDATNQMSFEWTNRGRQYNLETVTDEDQNSVNLYGLTIGSVQTIHSVCLGAVAQQVLSVQLKRSCYILRKAQFTLGWAYSILEPMDLVTVPEEYPATGTVAVRILTIEEDDKGNFAIEGEVLEYLGILSPALHQKQVSGGYTPGYGAMPSDTNAPIFFEVTPDMTNVNFAPVLTLLIALSGGVGWGGCGVYVSVDGGNSYQPAPGIQQTSPSNMGFTTGAYPWGADPDTTNLLEVNLQESLGEVFTVAKSVTDNFKALALIDDELISYEYATLTGANTYNFESGSSQIYMRRGAFGTFAVPHAINAPFTLIGDGNQFEYQLQPTDVGKTLWFKFPSFNQAGQQTQDLADATAYPFTVRGSQTRAPLPLVPYTAFNLGSISSPDNGTDAGMRMQQVNVDNSDGSVSTGIGVTLIPPANMASTAIKTPGFTSVTVGSGGGIPAGTYLVALSGIDSTGHQTDFALTTVIVPGAGSAVTITPSWPTGTVGYQVWMGVNIDQLIQVSVSLSMTPSTIIVSLLHPVRPPNYITAGVGYPAEPLDMVYDHSVLTAFAISHGGVWGAQAASYLANTVTIAGASFTTNQFANYKLKLYAAAEGTGFPFIPLLEVTILSNTSDVLTTDTDFAPFYSPDGNVLGPGNVWVCRMRPQSITATGFSDPNLVNGFASGGLNVNQDAGNFIVAIEGTGAGEIFNYIQSNTNDSFTIEGPWAVEPDDTTIFVICHPLPLDKQPTPGGATSGLGTVTSTAAISINSAPQTYPNFAPVGTVVLPNQQGISVLIVAQAADSNGNLADFGLSPMQEAWVWGQPGSEVVANPGYYTITPSGGIATIDLANGFQQRLVLVSGGNVEIPSIIWTGGPPIAPGINSLSLYLDTDGGTGPWSSPTFDTSLTPTPGTFATDVPQTQIAPIPSTRTSMSLTVHAGPVWALNFPPRTGGAIS